MEFDKKIISILILIIFTLGGILIFKILNDKNPNFKSNTKYSKSQIIDLIKSEDNKSNYEVEYTLASTKYKIQYLNKKMKYNTLSTTIYLDFNENKNVSISEKNKTAVIQQITNFKEIYMLDDILKVVESSDCTIEKEEIVSNRNAIVLNYNGTEKINSLFSSDNYSESINYNMKLWIDIQSGLLLQTMVKVGNKEEKNIYNLKLNTVTDADVTVPDLSQYKVVDMTKK